MMNLNVFVAVCILCYAAGLLFLSYRKAMTPLRFYLVSGVFLGVAYLAVLLPWTIPDGGNHFWSAYQRVSAVLDGGDGHLARACDIAGWEMTWCENPSQDAYARFLQAKDLPVDETLVENHNGMEELLFYGDFNYWPMMLGIFLARVLHLGFLPLVYLGRLFQMVVVLAGWGYAVYRAPRGQYLLALLGAFPMMLQTLNGYSYDGMVAVVTVNFIASVLWARRDDHNRGAYFHVLVFAILLGFTKGGGYLILLPLVFLLHDNNRKLTDNAKRILLPVLCGLVAVYLADVVFAPGTLYQVEASGEAMMSTADVWKNPLGYLRLLGTTYSYVQSKFYFLSMLGAYVGFLEYINPSHGIYLAIALMIVISYLEPERGKRFKAWEYLILILPAVIAVVSIPAMLLKDTPIGETVVRGIQGRYFLPVFPLLLLAMDSIFSHAKDGYGISVRRVRTFLILAFGALQCYFLWHTMTVFLGR